MGDSGSKPDSSARIQIVVAVIGLVGAIAAAVIGNWGALFHRSTAGPAVSGSSSTQPEKKTERPVFSSGELMVRPTWDCDLDTGAVTDSTADFWWQEQGPVKRALTPESGAEFYVVGVRDFESLKFAEIEHFPFSAQPIDGSDVKGENDIPKGTVVAYRTKQGRLGKLLIESYGHNLTIRWTTYEK